MARILIEAFREIVTICYENLILGRGLAAIQNPTLIQMYDRLLELEPKPYLPQMEGPRVIEILFDIADHPQESFSTNIANSTVLREGQNIDVLPLTIKLIIDHFGLKTKIRDALTMIEHFLNVNPVLAFNQLNPRLIALQLAVRVIAPQKIKQHTHPLCGPVILMQAFAENSPDNYVNYVIGLCLHRTADITIRAGQILQITVDAGARLLTRTPTYNEIPQADYVALASLRYSTAYLHYEQQFTWRWIQGATTDGEFMRWLAQAGYQNIADHTMTRLRGLIPWAARISGNYYADKVGKHMVENNITMARNLLHQGHIIFGNVAHLLAEHVVNNKPGPGPRLNYIADKAMVFIGGHWAIIKTIEFHADGIEFEISSWGRERTKIVNESKVGSWWRGFISAQP